MHVCADRLDWEEAERELADDTAAHDAQPFSGQLISYEGFPLQITSERGLQASVSFGQELAAEEDEHTPQLSQPVTGSFVIHSLAPQLGDAGQR